MNLNLNDRIEFYEISEGTQISGYLKQIMDYHFALPNEDDYAAFKGFKLKAADQENSDTAAVRVGRWG